MKSKALLLACGLLLFMSGLVTGMQCNKGLMYTPPLDDEKCENVYPAHFFVGNPKWQPGRGVWCTHVWLPPPWVDVAYCRCK